MSEENLNPNSIAYCAICEDGIDTDPTLDTEELFYEFPDVDEVGKDIVVHVECVNKALKVLQKLFPALTKEIIHER